MGSMKKNVAIIMVLTIFSKFFGFFREVALTYYYGASAVSDAYLTANVIPQVLFTLVGTGLATTFIPIFNKIMNKEGEEEANLFTSNIINIVLILATVLVLLVMLFTKPVIMIFAPGFIKSPESLNLSIQFTRISIFGVYFSGVIYIFTSFLQSKNNFLIPAMLGIPLNFVTIISFAIASKTSNSVLAYGIIISMILQVALLIPAAIKLHFKYTFKLDFKDKYVREMLFLAIPVFIGSSVSQLNTVVDKNMASRLQTGTVSALNYGNKLNGFVQGIFVTPLATVIYPSISQMVIDKNEKGLKNTINNSIIMISIFVIPATIGAMVISKPIVDLLFLRGEFTESASMMTSTALFFYAIGMLFFALGQIFTRVFYSFNDTKIPMISGVIGVIVNIILNILLIGPLGIGGLALATSLSAVIRITILILSLKKKVKNFGFREILGKMIKIALASILMGIGTYISFNYFTGFLGQNISTLISIGVGGLLYLLIILVIGIDEVKDLINKVRSKLSRN